MSLSKYFSNASRFKKKSSTGNCFYDTLDLLICSFKCPPSIPTRSYISGLRCGTKTYKKQQVQTKIAFHLAKMEKAPYRVACSFSSVFTSHWRILPTDKCNSIIHIMKGKEVQVCISFPFQEGSSLFSCFCTHMLFFFFSKTKNVEN